MPEFWEWLVHKGRGGHVKIPFEIIDEIKSGTKEDLLYTWIRNPENIDALLLDEEVSTVAVQQVVNRGYASDLTDDQIEGLGRDPFLIAYALGHPDRWVVTNETRTNKQRQNRKIPDVCTTLGVQWCDAFTFNNALDFRTSWKR